VTHTITRKHKFDAGHRVYGHESKCAHIHGHEYHVEIECAPFDSLDDLGRVIDFSVVKEVCCKWIDDHLDHGMLLYQADPIAEHWIHGFSFEGQMKVEYHKHFIMTKNPTAENIAEMLFKKFTDLMFGHSVKIVSVTVQETTNCRAKFSE